MKVIFFINDLSKGGKERQFVEIVKHMHQNEKIKCCVVMLNDSIDFDDLSRLNISINILGSRTDSKIKKIISFNKIIKNLILM